MPGPVGLEGSPGHPGTEGPPGEKTHVAVQRLSRSFLVLVGEGGRKHVHVCTS
jgi:hypothetical protein